VSDINKFNIEDLLERNVVQPISHLLNKNIDSQIVMVTGAGGSIGSELCKQIIKLNPTKLVLIEINEFALYKIQSELNELLIKYDKLNKIKIFSFLVSIQDKIKISDIIKKISSTTL
jgi:FlaA1/EpsC-like NDP-sugar epimerase